MIHTLARMYGFESPPLAINCVPSEKIRRGGVHFEPRRSARLTSSFSELHLGRRALVRRYDDVSQAVRVPIGYCFDHAHGRCKRGAMCRFSHDFTSLPKSS